MTHRSRSRARNAFGILWAAFSLLVCLAEPAFATDYYVAPTGSDSNPGSAAQPFASMARGQTAASAGDTVYFASGTYSYSKGTTTCSSQTATISGVVLNKSGTAGKLIKYWAKAGAKPVFDFDGIRDSCRIKGILVSGSYIHIKGIEIQGVRQNNNLNHESWGLWNQGSNNIFEGLDVHDIMGAGIFIQNGANNLILNCDSHDNLDPLTSNGAGESADGFGCHVSANNSGNVFRGCRAWWNADDGYDFINARSACVVEDSWAWYNGYEPGTQTAIGNGNGFKGGGYGADPATFPAQPSVHEVKHCLSVANRAAGFYANHHPSTLHFYNNTGFGNHPNFNMLGMNASGADITVGVYRNNVALGGTLFSNRNSADEVNNAWTLGVTVSNADFQNPVVAGLDAARQADGSLPVLTNFRLASGSDLIDAGVNLGMPYAGSAPDLGAFETGLAASGGTGGTAGSGGASSTGGATGSGSGGSLGSGGDASSGGAVGSGGSGSGGDIVGGGGAVAASGGAIGSGGASDGSGGLTANAGAFGGEDSGDLGPDSPAGCACEMGTLAGGTSQASALLGWIVLAGSAVAARARRRSSLGDNDKADARDDR